MNQLPVKDSKPIERFRPIISFAGSLLLIILVAGVCSGASSNKQSSEIIPVEVFHVAQLPVAISGVEIVKTVNGYQLRCAMTNYSDDRLLGFRYSLVAIDSNRVTSLVANRSEAWMLTPYATKRKKFGTLITLNHQEPVRFVLMLEQIVGRESIWEVVKAKETLQSYASGDYSIVPEVLRVPNYVDTAPQQQRIRY